MGFGGSEPVNKGGKGKAGGQQEGMMRDTLGFLKKSEQEKKQREEQKKQSQIDANSRYKSVSEVVCNLNGYQSPIQFDYDFTINQLSAAARQKLKTVCQEQPVS